MVMDILKFDDSLTNLPHFLQHHLPPSSTDSLLAYSNLIQKCQKCALDGIKTESLGGFVKGSTELFHIRYCPSQIRFRDCQLGGHPRPFQFRGVHPASHEIKEGARSLCF